MTEKQAIVLDWTARRSRLAGVEHMACALTGGDATNLVRRVLRPLIQAGYIRMVTCFARARPAFTAPIIAWQTGEPEPDYSKDAYRIDRCWHGLAPRAVRACVATAKAAAIMGAPRHGCKNHLQLSHDLATSMLYAFYLRRRPEEAAWWVGENMLEPQHGEKCPDALLVRDQKILQAIEVGGFRYGQERIAAFHRFCRERQLPYVVF